ncbi:hypothetical protein IFM89_027873 [Coptis chinensis]|uniref:RNase H type-1 domain-containing protein n=1 Tax=Coptis chinensis TaxID=261450 RepID=A0A835HFW1_9MAGN|nr:hypothetical protein IFM89_027873 [Coptis chinensis]
MEWEHKSLSYGDVARDENGEVLFAYTGSRGARSVMYQELKAIEQGLHKCKDFLVRKLVVVSDSLKAINALNSKENASWETNRAADY